MAPANGGDAERSRGAFMLPYALQRLAALHEETGRPDRAAEYHARLLDLWTDPDALLQPRVASAQQALARHTGER